MGLKEKDTVRIFGVLPSQGADPIPVGKIPDGGIQVAKSNLIVNNTVIIHPVTADKILYLSALSFSSYNASGGVVQGTFFVTNADDALQYTFFTVLIPDDRGPSDAMGFMPPLEIPAGYKIKITSDTANFWIYGFIHGYEM